jgi:hypothetical protein
VRVEEAPHLVVVLLRLGGGRIAVVLGMGLAFPELVRRFEQEARLARSGSCDEDAAGNVDPVGA